MTVNGLRREKLGEGKLLRQWAKHARLHSDLLQALTGEMCPLWVRSRGNLNCGVHSTPLRGFSACLHRLHVCSTIVFIA